ncbi:MAG: type II toxin-antitoxin system VapC family toxin [Candidatus Helarchaeota archaeon]
MPVIDSGIFASIVVKDEFYKHSKRYLRSRKSTLDFSFAEAGTVIWKHVQMGRISRTGSEKRVKLLGALINTSHVYKAESYLGEALNLAIENNISVYDALFIALARALNEKLITTDKKLYEKLKRSPLQQVVECIEP